MYENLEIGYKFDRSRRSLLLCFLEHSNVAWNQFRKEMRGIKAVELFQHRKTIEVTSRILIVQGASSYTWSISGKRLEEMICIYTCFVYCISMHIFRIFSLGMDIFNDSVLGSEANHRSRISQHLLLLESLIFNHIYLPAFEKQFSI